MYSCVPFLRADGSWRCLAYVRSEFSSEAPRWWRSCRADLILTMSAFPGCLPCHVIRFQKLHAYFPARMPILATPILQMSTMRSVRFRGRNAGVLRSNRAPFHQTLYTPVEAGQLHLYLQPTKKTL
jgi:hypothetical protein